MKPTRRQFVGTLGIPCALASPAAGAFPRLAQYGNEFRFIINADPHANRDRPNQPHPHNESLRAFVKEVNAIAPQPAFVLFNGDIFERNFIPESTRNVIAIATDLKALPIAVTGNHDCRDFDVDQTFRPVQKAFNGTTADTFSFDCGAWHFVAMPTKELLTTREKEDTFLAWLDNDLRANRARPTMAFMHYHLLPVGTSQLEFYTYSIDYKNRLLDALTRYGNVRYVFSGHVHAGIQPSVKTAWRYRNVNFIIAPSPVKPRPFGEEYKEFTLDGGYYLIVDIKGDQARLTGRQTGRPAGHVYSATTREYDRSIDPRCLSAAWNLPANGNWQSPHRYISDQDPGYVCSWSANHARIAVHEKGQGWAVGEFAELYRVIKAANGAEPALELKYKPTGAGKGGGYIWVAGFSGKQAQCVMMFHWGPKMTLTHALRRTISYLLTAGEDRGAGIEALARSQKALFWKVPAENTSHELKINLAQAMDQATGKSDAYKALGVDRLIFAIGAWCAIPPGSKSEASFDEINLTFDGRLKTMTVDGQPFDARRHGLNLIVESA